jgi:hypothetical protein
MGAIWSPAAVEKQAPDQGAGLWTKPLIYCDFRLISGGASSMLAGKSGPRPGNKE